MKTPPTLEAAAAAAELAALVQARTALKAVLAVAGRREQGLARVEEVTLPGPGGALPARYYEAAGAHRAPLLVFFHGGGFVVGDIDTHDSMCSRLAVASGGRVLSVGYRLAPETRFPGQLEDAVSACAWALEHASRFGAASDRIAVGGDSAGAYLAMRAAIACNARSAGAVALQVLLYPLVHIDGPLWAEEDLRNFRFLGRIAVTYIGRSLGAESFPSLTELDLSRAPCTIIAGGRMLDPVRADVEVLTQRLVAAGVRVIERNYPALMHGGLNLTAVSKTALGALDEVGALLRTELAS